MPVISAYMCPETQRVFQHRNEYLAHLRELARKRIDERKMNRIRLVKRELRRFISQRKTLMAPLYRASTFDDIGEWIADNSRLVYLNALAEQRMNPWLEQRRFDIPDDFRIHSIVWADNIRHHQRESECWRGPRGRAPLGLDPTEEYYARRQYLQWSGRIDFVVEGYHYRMVDLHDIFRALGIFADSGSGNSLTGKHYCVATMFCQDFPSLAVAEELKWQEWLQTR